MIQAHFLLCDQFLTGLDQLPVGGLPEVGDPGSTELHRHPSRYSG